MKSLEKRNRNKQLQKNRNSKIDKETELYKNDGIYRVITVIHLSSTRLEVNLKLPYNFILHQEMGLSQTSMSKTDMSYLIRSSDLLLLTVSNVEIDADLVSFLKRYLPTTIIVYERKAKSIAKSVSKLFGDVKIMELSMVNSFLAKTEMSNTMLCQQRPFMVAANAHQEGEHLMLEGFMKKGLLSDKVIINGAYEGVVEEVALLENGTIPGGDLNEEYDESKFLVKKDLNEEENGEGSNELQDEYEGQNEGDNESTGDDFNAGDDFNEDNSEYEEGNADFGDSEEIDPKFDLIEKYKDYQGIRNLATCKFEGEAKPEYYKDLVFMRSTTYSTSVITKRKSIIPPNSVVKLKIRVFQNVTSPIIVLFGLFAFETRPTIQNYEFASQIPLARELVIDNGYRIYSANGTVSRNLNNNLFQEEPGLLNGVVSSVSPFSFFATTAYILNLERPVRLQNGFSDDRMFFTSVVLKGMPIKIYKKYVVIRRMFYTKEQVEYFRNIKLETDSGNTGFVKKPLGTKGSFKAYFTQPIKHGEVVKMRLYKRIFL